MNDHQPVKTRKSRAKFTAAAPEVLATFKAFEPGFVCRGFQYEIGKTYTHTGPIVRCTDAGFHSCINPADVLQYYPLVGSVFAETEASGVIDRDESDSKIASAQIAIKAEIRLPDFIKRIVQSVAALAKDKLTTGNRSAAATTGKHAIACALGQGATSKAGADGWIVLAAWKWIEGAPVLLHVRAGKIGDDGLEPDTFYRLTDLGAFERVTP